MVYAAKPALRAPPAVVLEPEVAVVGVVLALLVLPPHAASTPANGITAKSKIAEDRGRTLRLGAWWQRRTHKRMFDNTENPLRTAQEKAENLLRISSE